MDVACTYSKVKNMSYRNAIYVHHTDPLSKIDTNDPVLCRTDSNTSKHEIKLPLRNMQPRQTMEGDVVITRA